MERIERVTDARGGASASAIAHNLAEARGRIARACSLAGRAADTVTILAVTKGFGPEAIEAALAAGLTDVGENYFQEAQAKFAAAAWSGYPVRRHFLGHVQSNKARRIAGLFDVVQTVDEASVAANLDAGALAAEKVLDVLIQVNVTGDRRAGIEPSRVVDFAKSLQAFRGLRVRGLMSVGPADAKQTASAFATAGAAFRAMQRAVGADVFSLGMSGDLEAAVAAGSTMVRLGTALFGARPAKV